MIRSKSYISGMHYKIKYTQGNFENAEVLKFLFEILLCFIASRTQTAQKLLS